ncbi:Uncharacterised protein [uncultured archaeon]|nr:Uncharacterised protein [uncultured archaeon]
MALFINNEPLRSWSSAGLPKNAIGGYVFIDKNLLSVPYDIHKEVEVEGIIIESTNRNGEVFKELNKTKITFIFIEGSSSRDFLFISKDNWPNIRDYGVILGDSFISIKIEKIKVDGKEILIYPKRDVCE